MRPLLERLSRICLLAAILAMAHPLRAAYAAAHHDRYHGVALALRSKYDSLLPSLALEEQRHLAVRLYRVTGDTAYMGPIVADLRRAEDDLRRDVSGKDSTDYIMRRTDELLEGFNPKTRKGHQRRQLFKQRREMLYALNILDNAKRVEEHSPVGSIPDSLFQSSLDYLRGIDFSRVLLDESVIRVFSPQAVNYIYYLDDLGITDLRGPYAVAFRRVFPDSRDVKLSKYKFRDKIYGLTHFILAASDYYQHPADSAEMSWILDYFSSHMDRILIEGTSDIIAEVGICFLLAGRAQDPSVVRCRDQICIRFDPESQMLLSPHGSDDVEKGEHRNVLAYMLLSWPESLYPGPYVRKSE